MGLRMFMQIPRKSANACYSVSDIPKNGETSEALISDMHVITRKRLNMFADKYPETRTALAHWYKVVKGHNFSSFVELRTHFPSADQVGKLTVFNIGGNKVRLIAAIHYNRHKLYIRAVLTHAEYDQGK